jgi:PhoPQ-activated pathogenicity-related protein
MGAILMTKEFWLESQFSIARFYGGICTNGTRYIIMGSEQDLVNNDFAKYYRKLGRDRFIQVLEHHKHESKTSVAQAMKNALSEFKVIKRTVKQQNNKQQTKLEL